MASSSQCVELYTVKCCYVLNIVGRGLYIITVTRACSLTSFLLCNILQLPSSVSGRVGKVKCLEF